MRRPSSPSAAMRRLALMHCALCAALLTAPDARAQEPSADAQSLLQQRRYAQALELLAPMEATSAGDARYFYLLGRAAFGAGEAERARVALERSIELDPDDTNAHLALGRAYHALDQHANALNQFEVAMHLENLPPDVLTQVRIYDDAAREALEEGRRTTTFGYAATGVGRYRVNSTRGTNTFGGGDRRETFYNLRVGGGLNHAFANDTSLDASLDYRHREYDAGSRDDRDLRWSFAASHGFNDSRFSGGLRGRVSYRGNGDYRNDVAGFIDYTHNLDVDSQLTTGLSVQRRRYPEGPLRDRSRTTTTGTIGWSHSFNDGAANFGITAHAGRNTATSRPDGNSDVFGATANLDWTFSDTLDAFVFVWWERDDFSADDVRFHPDERDVAMTFSREDNLYEGGAGLVWSFADGWSFRPELLYIRDQSNVVALNYSSTEAWLNVRADF
ncbi:tetratricopeptide repeat protein [Lysobacter auxotrophicus]|uniref:Tetratricopeptide repeat protein n=1 Tax=Lysobacter auxotrophicus TaxID=2992573 RepID=A0ABN6UKS3_9GAMM|nr:tetratricopeptide repeat protein [Lysobacter auxotrophicus]BDU16725.1 tetratricopeptide repeat protein [Lysobacter auxotrophicus]